jgi:hypothetical protein
MTLPLNQRSIDVRMHFGQTEIDTRGTNVHTGDAVNTALQFDTLD